MEGEIIMALLSLDKIITMEKELYTKYYDFSEVRYNEMTREKYVSDKGIR